MWNKSSRKKGVHCCQKRLSCLQRLEELLCQNEGTCPHSEKTSIFGAYRLLCVQRTFESGSWNLARLLLVFGCTLIDWWRISPWYLGRQALQHVSRQLVREFSQLTSWLLVKRTEVLMRSCISLGFCILFVKDGRSAVAHHINSCLQANAFMCLVHTCDCAASFMLWVSNLYRLLNCVTSSCSEFDVGIQSCCKHHSILAECIIYSPTRYLPSKSSWCTRPLAKHISTWREPTGCVGATWGFCKRHSIMADGVSHDYCTEAYISRMSNYLAACSLVQAVQVFVFSPLSWRR